MVTSRGRHSRKSYMSPPMTATPLVVPSLPLWVLVSSPRRVSLSLHFLVASGDSMSPSASADGALPATGVAAGRRYGLRIAPLPHASTWSSPLARSLASFAYLVLFRRSVLFDSPPALLFLSLRCCSPVRACSAHVCLAPAGLKACAVPPAWQCQGPSSSTRRARGIVPVAAQPNHSAHRCLCNARVTDLCDHLECSHTRPQPTMF